MANIFIIIKVIKAEYYRIIIQLINNRLILFITWILFNNFIKKPLRFFLFFRLLGLIFFKSFKSI